MSRTIALLGVGKLGEALLSGLIRSGTPAAQLIGAEKHAERAEEIAGRQRWLRDDLEPLDEHRCAFETSDDSLEWLALRIAFLGVDFDVVEPPELRDWCGRAAERFRRASVGAGPQS